MLTIRPVREDDFQMLQELIAISARLLSKKDYTDGEIEAAVQYIFGIDSELIIDESYFVVEKDGQLAACGGWSRRRTLFGGDQFTARESGYLDPEKERAKIRAFFVHPDFARQGIGKALLQHCEKEAKKYGFSSIEMMATLPGVKLYKAFGYAEDDMVTFETPAGGVRFIPMWKKL